VSFGIACGRFREPTVFARVSGLRAFLDDPDPVYAPQPLGRPAVAGRIAPGGRVRCVPPAFRNPVRRTLTVWGLDGRAVDEGASFTIPRRAGGRRVGCRVYAANAGGSTRTGRSPQPVVDG